MTKIELEVALAVWMAYVWIVKGQKYLADPVHVLRDISTERYQY